MKNIEEEIRKVAEELYYKSGCIPGRDKENWFEAEKIVMARLQAEAQKKKKKSSAKSADSVDAQSEEPKATKKTSRCKTSETKSPTSKKKSK